MSQSLSALEKALTVLESTVSRPTFSEIVASTGLAKATVHRIIVTLMEREFLTLTEDGHYLPGARFLSLAGTAFQDVNVPPLVKVVAKDLADRMNCTVHVGAHVGDQVVYIVRADPDKPYIMPSRVGATIPMHCSAMGKSILALLPEEKVSRTVSRTGLPRLTANTITDETKFRKELDDVRQCGYALDRQENVPGVICIGTAFSDYTNRPRFAVSLSTLSLEFSENDLLGMVPQLHEAAEKMSSLLGGVQIPALDSHS